jgi:hypothetical protein
VPTAIWLNPLLRLGFEAKAKGIRTMLPPRGRVPGHNLDRSATWCATVTVAQAGRKAAGKVA